MVELRKKDQIIKYFIIALLALTMVLLGLSNFYGADETVDITTLPGSGTKADPYILYDYDDFYLLQQYSQTNSCKGLYFSADTRLKDVKLQYIEDSEDEEGQEGEGIEYNLDLVSLAPGKGAFKGIGCLAYPFQGHLEMEGIMIRLDTPLFDTLGSQGEINNVKIFGNITNTKLVAKYGNNIPVACVAAVVYMKEANATTKIRNVWIQGAEVTAVSTSTMSAAGIVGSVTANAANTTLVLDTCSVDAEISCKGNVNGTHGNDVSTTAGLNAYPGCAAGLIGEAGTAKSNYYMNINLLGYNVVAGSLKSTAGGISCGIGRLVDKVKVSLGGKTETASEDESASRGVLDLSGMTGYSAGKGPAYSGYLIGSESYSLTYRNPGFNLILPTGTYAHLFDEVADIDGINSAVNSNVAGMIYAAPAFDNVVAGTGTEADPYILDSKEDYKWLSIAFCTAGYYGLDMFQYPTAKMNSETTVGLKATRLTHLRNAFYQVAKDVDLSNSGIRRMNRSSEVSFNGSFIGKKTGTKNPKLTVDVDSYQSGVAFFAFTANNSGLPVQFKHIDFEGKMVGRTNVSGLIHQLNETGNKTTRVISDYEIEDVHMDVDITNLRESENTNTAGFIGKIDLSNSNNTVYLPNFYFKDCSFTGDMTTKMNGSSYASGYIAYITQQPSACVKNYEIVFENCTLEGNISDSVKGNVVYQYGGFLSYLAKNNSYKNLKFYRDKVSYQIVAERTSVVLDNCSVNNVNITLAARTNKSGALIGYNWDQCEVAINNFKVKDVFFDYGGTTAGGLFQIVYGHVYVDQMDIQNFKMKQSAANTSSQSTLLMYQLGGGLFDITGLTIDSASGIDSQTVYTSEIIFQNNAAGNDHLQAGIVNINGAYDSFKGYESQGTYTQKGTLIENYGNGRLYYNMFEELTPGCIKGKGTKDSPIIMDSQAKLVLLSAMHGIHASNKDAFLKYFGDLTSTKTNPAEANYEKFNAVLTGYVVVTTDMLMNENGGYGYTYYPIQACGGYFYGIHVGRYLGVANPSETQKKQVAAALCQGTISAATAANYKPILRMDASKISTKNTSRANNNKELDYTWRYGFQVKGMYSGIFASIYGVDLTISNFQIEGDYYITYNKDDVQGGALITASQQNRSVNGDNSTYNAVSSSANVKIDHIDYGDCISENRVATGTGSGTGTGLMIGSITASTVNIDTVTILPGAKVRADALIGLLENSSTVNAKVVLRHMDLNEALANENIAAEKEGSYSQNGYGLKYGIFFYYLKSGTAIYWYNEENIEGVVPDTMTPGLVNDAEGGRRTTPNKPLLDNKKYAYKVVAVDVNPINSNITKGTGTEKDPFIIENVGQLLTLARCIKSEGTDTTSTDWYVGNVYGDISAKYAGYDESDSDTWDHSSNFMKRSDAVKYMSTAYYKLENDIKFTGNSNENIQNAADSYSGIGTEKIPFAGYFDGNNHKILMSNYGGNYAYVFGLFQYSKGVYVKDLTVSMQEALLVKNDSSVTAGMITAKNIGADSVFDNVTVEGKIMVDLTGSSSNVFAGGYIAKSLYGSVTLCNMSAKNFKNFSVVNSKNQVLTNYCNPSNVYKCSNSNIGGIVGFTNGTYYVYSDGATTQNPSSKQVLYGDEDSDYAKRKTGEKIIFSEINYENDYGLNPMVYAPILNENWLQAAGKMKVTKDAEGGYKVAVDNERQMVILSLGIESGSLCASDTDASNVYTYGAYAKAWKAKSAWSGPSLDLYSESDKIYDSIYPSIYQYFDFSDFDEDHGGTGKGYLEMIANHYGIMNQNGTNHNNLQYRVTYTLKENGYYDMASLDYFTGIGDNYLESDYYVVCQFCNNFDGNGSTIKLNMLSYKNNAWGAAGLFPRMSSTAFQNAGCEFVIQNFTLTGNVQANRYATAGVCGEIYNGRFDFKNIQLEDITISSYGDVNTGFYAAGLVAKNVNTNMYVRCENISLKNVEVSGYGHTGGVFGYAKNIQGKNITLDNVKVVAQEGDVGGLLANKFENGSNYDTTFENVTANHIYCESVKGAKSIGGLVGYVNHSGKHFSMHNITLGDDVTLKGISSAKKGAVVGTHNQTTGAGEFGILRYDDLDMKADGYLTIGNYLENTIYKDVEIYFYDFFELEAAENRYGIQREPNADGTGGAPYFEAITDAEDTFEADLDLIPSTSRKDNMLVKWSSDIGRMDVIVNSILNSLTNGTGELNGRNNANISVEVVPMKVEHGVVSENVGATPSMSITMRDNQYVVTNNNVYDTKEKTINGVYYPGTYSLIRVTYSIGGGLFTETAEIPFFVSNMINVDFYSRAVIGEEYNADFMRALRNTEISVSNDSSYTIYTEVMYSANREEFEEEIYMNKVFRLDKDYTIAIPKNTKLTLVDITDDKPHVYYYTVTDEVTVVPLTDFVDEDGVRYHERDISSTDELARQNKWETVSFKSAPYYKYNRGVERYFLFVDCSMVSANGNVSELQGQFRPSIMQNEALNDEQIFHYVSRCRTNLKTYYSRSIGWESEKVTATTSEGDELVISKNINLQLTGKFYDVAHQTYWNEVRGNDYNNSGKFLEVAVYLENEEGEKILFPSGTKVKLGNQSEYSTIKNTSNIYYYKDGADEDGFALNDIVQDTVTEVALSLDFSYAKMANLPSGKYRVCFDLVKTANAEYPMGNTELGTIKSDLIEVVSSAEYGFRFDVDSVGEQVYNKALEGSSYELDYRMLLNSTLLREDVDRNDIKIKYVLYKKDKTTGIYSPYVTDAMVASAGAGAGLEAMGPEVTLDLVGEEVSLDGQEHWYTVTSIAAKGEAMTELDCKLTLTEDMEATNYKIVANVYVNDFVEATDELIFNIADIDV